MRSRSNRISGKPFGPVLVALLLTAGAAGCSLTPSRAPQSRCIRREGLDSGIGRVVDEFRSAVREAMRKDKVPGCAVALLDERGILWAEGFGYTDRRQRIPITPQTPFLTCSVSKTITATTVLLAVEEGLLGLDKPISTYLPDFRVNSRYEEHPQQRITLRRLLSHTAGLPLDAPVGNIFDVTGSFEEHVRSTDGTWLMYPVGGGFGYSNIGIDLAAYALRTAAGVPFEQYVETRLFTPLGMSNSLSGDNRILAREDRALGHTIGFATIPSVIPAVGAGGFYASAEDLARFVQLHLNQGLWQGRQLLDESLLEAMYAPQSLSREPNLCNGLGIGVACGTGAAGGPRYLGHRGAGYGFEASMKWYPEFGLGEIILANRMPAPALMGLSLLERLIASGVVQRRFHAPAVGCAARIPVWHEWPLHCPSPYRPQWGEYCGTYDLEFGGYQFVWWARLGAALLNLDGYIPRIRVYEEGGGLRVTESRFFEQVLGRMWDRQVAESLAEVRPGLFSTASGAILEVRQWPALWRNYRLRKR